MDTLLHISEMIGGLFIGLLVWSRAVHWIHAIWIVLKSRGSGAKTSSAALLALVFNSGLWLFAGFVAFSIYVLSLPNRAEWAWFFGGVLATPLLIAINVFWFFRRRRNAKLKSVGKA